MHKNIQNTPNSIHMRARCTHNSQQDLGPFPAAAPPPHKTSRRGSSSPRQPPSATNLGMLCKYRRRRTSSAVLQWGFNQTVFLVVIIATARPDLSLVPVKGGKKKKSCKDVKQSLVPGVNTSLPCCHPHHLPGKDARS